MPALPLARPRLGTVASLLAAGALVSVVTALLHARAATPEASPGRPPMPVASVDYRVEESYPLEQRFLGLVQAATRSAVGFEIPGTIADVQVREGDRVDAGTVLAVLDTQTLDARRAAAAAELARVAAELQLAQARTQRQRPLAQQGAISEQTFDDTRLAEKALESALAAARATLNTLDIEKEKSALRAPFAAQVGEQLLDRGAVTQPGVPVFRLVATADREAHIGVAVEQARHLQPGSGYPLAWRGERFTATLRSVRPDVNPVSMTTVAIFDLPPTLAAFDGEPVAISLPREVAVRGGWLPLSALLEGERGIWTVLRLTREGGDLRTIREVVEVLHVSGDRAYVRGTLNDGDRVVADGVHRIAPGTRVSIAGV